MRLADFHYSLPSELIARYPLEERSASRLLHIDHQGQLTHCRFSNLFDFISENDLLVFNNSKVIPARLKGHKETGGKIEILVERILDDKTILAHLRANKSPPPESILYFKDNYRFTVKGRQQNLFILDCQDTATALEVIEKIGEIPLPPYLHRPAEEKDKERYQTIYAENKGSVAAPTAGLHFDQPMLDKLKAKGVDFAFLTLHVGAGTFLPVRTENILEHHMHAEYIAISTEVCKKIKKTQAQGGKVIAVGTTSARALETASHNSEISPYAGDTQLFIYPGYNFRCVDALITNFHLPESSLLMLVAALGDRANIMKAYREAVKQQYRFYSYGDAMMVTKAYP